MKHMIKKIKKFKAIYPDRSIPYLPILFSMMPLTPFAFDRSFKVKTVKKAQ